MIKVSYYDFIFLQEIGNQFTSGLDKFNQFYDQYMASKK